jgi:hypothetical protein
MIDVPRHIFNQIASVSRVKFAGVTKYLSEINSSSTHWSFLEIQFLGTAHECPHDSHKCLGATLEKFLDRVGFGICAPTVGCKIRAKFRNESEYKGPARVLQVGCDGRHSRSLAPCRGLKKLFHQADQAAIGELKRDSGLSSFGRAGFDSRDMIAPMSIRPRKYALVFCGLIVAFGSVLADDFNANKTVGYYMNTQNAPEWKNWIGGIGVGFLVANKELAHLKRAPLFCFFGPLEPDPQAVLDAWIAKERTKGNVKPNEYFGDRLYLEVAMLIAYKDSFPCTPAHK